MTSVAANGVEVVDRLPVTVATEPTVSDPRSMADPPGFGPAAAATDVSATEVSATDVSVTGTVEVGTVEVGTVVLGSVVPGSVVVGTAGAGPFAPVPAGVVIAVTGAAPDGGATGGPMVGTAGVTAELGPVGAPGWPARMAPASTADPRRVTVGPADPTVIGAVVWSVVTVATRTAVGAASALGVVVAPRAAPARLAERWPPRPSDEPPARPEPGRCPFGVAGVDEGARDWATASKAAPRAGA
jgi:hypothetical protein